MFKRILIPLDGSELAEKSLPLAITLGHQFDSDIILIRMIELLHPPPLLPHLTSTTAVNMAETYQQARAGAESYLVAQQQKLREAGFEAQTILCETLPAEGIIYAAQEYKVDCIVMSTHGRSGIARWTLGSVADKVARHAPCPVLLVRQNNLLEQENENFKTTTPTYPGG